MTDELMKKGFRCFFCIILLLTGAFFHIPDIRADSFDTFGIGSRLKALGGAGTAVAGDIHAVYYNPAALSGLTGAALGLEYSYSLLDLELERTGPNDLLDYTVDDAGMSGNIDLSSIDASNEMFESARNAPDIKGLNLMLAGPLFRGLSFGLAAHVPGRTLVKQ